MNFIIVFLIYKRWEIENIVHNHIKAKQKDKTNFFLSNMVQRKD